MSVHSDNIVKTKTSRSASATCNIRANVPFYPHAFYTHCDTSNCYCYTTPLLELSFFHALFPSLMESVLLSPYTVQLPWFESANPTLPLFFSPPFPLYPFSLPHRSTHLTGEDRETSSLGHRAPLYSKEGRMAVWVRNTMNPPTRTLQHHLLFGSITQ